MIDRRMFTTLVGSAAVLPHLSPSPAFAQATQGQTVFYSAVGGDLTLYGMNVDDASLTMRGTVSLPANVQYAWAHPWKKFFYAVSSTRGSGGVEGSPDDKHLAHASRIDPASGALTLHAYDLWSARIYCNWRLDELWRQHARSILPVGRLRRAYSQGRETSRFAVSAADQVRIHDQPQDRKDTRAWRAADAARARQ